ncbi:MAG TPA: RsmE family RNA methyltransferase [Puia sp.]|jgi:16S rRNA (uracil1498-N3)-methyltransferase|nr:RsmE family RNA methyltransferase [Puia sp.]
MALPFFYITAYVADQQELILDEGNSRHVVQVLRMKPGESLRLTDGKGALLTAEIIDDHKKKCRVSILTATFQPPPERKVTIAISPLKNASRFEWFLEKATEIGVSAVIPLVCERTERPSIRHDRLQQIAVSALLQSQQAWLPDLAAPIPLADLLPNSTIRNRYIAHCLEAPCPTVSLTDTPQADHSLILIGPEGDFSIKEIENALAAGFIPVTLGPNRLRTETAGVVAATLLCIA